MTIPAWPSTLPKPLRDGYGVQPNEARRLTQPDTGPLRSRRAFTRTGKRVSMTLDVDRYGRSQFELFFEETTALGSLPFTMEAPDAHGWPLLDGAGAPVLDGGGAPLLIAEIWTCLFGRTPPATTPIGNRFRISFDVEVLP